MNNSKELSLKALKAAIAAATQATPEKLPVLIPEAEMGMYLPNIQNGSKTPASTTKSHEAILEEQKQKVLNDPEKYGLHVPTVEQQLAIVRAVREAVEQGVSAEDIENLLNKPVYHNTYSYNDVTSTSYEHSVKEPGHEVQSYETREYTENTGGVGEYNGESVTKSYSIPVTHYVGRTYNYAYTHEINKRTQRIDFTLFDILNADVKAEIVHNAVDQAQAVVKQEMVNKSADQAKLAYYSSVVELFAEEKSVQNKVAEFNRSRDALAKTMGERQLKIAYGENYDAAKLFFVEMMQGFLAGTLFEQQSKKASTSTWVSKFYDKKPRMNPTGFPVADALLAKKLEEVSKVHDELHEYLPLASYIERMGRNLKLPDEITDEYVIKCMSDPASMQMLFDNLDLMNEKQGDYAHATKNLAVLLARVDPGLKEWEAFYSKIREDQATINDSMPKLEKMIALVEWLQQGAVVTIGENSDNKGRLISNGYNDDNNKGHNAIEGILPYLGVLAINTIRIQSRSKTPLPSGLTPINIDSLEQLRTKYLNTHTRPATLSEADRAELTSLNRVYAHLKNYVEAKNDAGADTMVGRVMGDAGRKLMTFKFSAIGSSSSATFRCEREDLLKWPGVDLPRKSDIREPKPDTTMQVEEKSSTSMKPGGSTKN